MEIIFKSERLTYRCIKEDDVDQIYEYSSDYENTRFMYTDKSIEETKNYVNKTIIEMKKENPNYLSYLVILNEHIIGEVFALREDNAFDIGYIINKNYFGYGYGFESAKTLISYLHNKYNCHIFYIRCDERNKKSRRLIQKLKMKYLSKEIKTNDKNEIATELKYVLHY